MTSCIQNIGSSTATSSTSSTATSSTSSTTTSSTSSIAARSISTATSSTPSISLNDWIPVQPQKKKKLPKQNPLDDSKGSFDDFKEPGVLHPARVKFVPNAHADYISCILKFSPDRFITGSRDGSLKAWNFDGTLSKNIYTPRYDYPNSITALSRLGKNRYLSGSKTGWLAWWSPADRYETIKTFPHVPPNRRNRDVYKITCLASNPSGSQSGSQFFIGWRGQFNVQSGANYATVNRCITGENNCVYAIHPLSPKKLLVATGCNLSVFENDDMTSSNSDQWEQTDLFLTGPSTLDNPRPYISAMSRLPENENQVGLSFFNGFVRVFDLENQTVVFKPKEHEGRVWAIEPFDQFNFASCGDDGSIKFWDLRVEESVTSIQENPDVPGRVSVLMKTDEHCFISGYCPNDVDNSPTKATLSIWDRRKF